MSAFGDAMKALKNVMLMQERIEGLRHDNVRIAEDLRSLSGHVFDLDKRVLRIETIIEITRGGGASSPRITG